jgi:hypothetical protein
MSYEGNVNIRTLLVPGATLFNQSVTANTDILPADLNIATAITSKQTKVVGTYTIELCFDTAGKFSIMTKYGGTTHFGYINVSANLAAHEVFTLTKVMPEAWDMNFQFSADATLKWLVVTLHGGIY